MPERIVGLRSDTVPHPTDAMRRATYEAELGDDVYGGDPIVNRLVEVSAERLGKEAADLRPRGGTMAPPAMLDRTARPDAEQCPNRPGRG